MNGKKANRAFLITVICYIGLSCAIALFFPEMGNSLFLSNLLSELVVVLPILTAVLLSGEKLSEFLGFHKMKMGTVLMTVLFTFLSMPTVTLLNLISQLWVENAVVSMMDSLKIGQMSFLQLFFPLGVMAPVFEEIACRGAYYRSYRRSGSGFGAMMLSAAIFALMHMNLNQAMYAFGIGILLVMLVEASGSLWSSILYHALVNGGQAILMYILAQIDPTVFSSQAAAVTTDYLLFAIGAYLLLAAVTLPAAWAVLIWISNHEGKRGVLLQLFTPGRKTAEPAAEEGEQTGKKKKDRTLTLSLIIALILCILVMTGILFEWIKILFTRFMTWWFMTW